MTDHYTLAQSAEYLQVSENFVRTMVDKKRLTPDAEGRVTQAQLDELAQLIGKLKGGGIAAMVSSVDQHL
ncbi:helix-turn-helix domain-containing protein [Gilvimarinus xylanilyticus]|uniref:Helix-turn-helix domain-containing protein n=1 Tax=Gilvimarinus xylanilyticus TaxID=2944139 RepID=A0A9X2I947_9GAMM|nr:helix-turn-helix domain-containing protein [Gilvimarinus xylanilyticus]MCP8901022.1 helix-turn-helix domain-containing protein [Gilvimarinus xylanilyticus]